MKVKDVGKPAPLPVISVKINQTVIGWLAVLHNSACLVHVTGMLRLEIS